MNEFEAVTLAATALFAAAVIYAATISGRRVLRDTGRLRLFELLSARRLAAPSDEAAARAVRRCMTCPSQAQCDELLAAQKWQPLLEICPNTAYIDRLAAAAR